MKSKSFILLNDILNKFPKRIELFPKAIECDNGGVYISKGFHGFFANILKVKLCHKKELSVYKEAPIESTFNYNIVLVKDKKVENIVKEELIPQHISISSSFCYLVGSVVNDGITSHDIDLLIRKGAPDWMFQHIVSSLMMSHVNSNLFNIIEDIGLGPMTKYCNLYDLILERVSS